MMACSSNHEHTRKEFEQRVLSQMEERLVELLDVKSICKGLCDQCIFDSTDSAAVQGTKKDQVKFFVGRLLARGPSSYSVFLDLLRKSGRESHVQLAREFDSFGHSTNDYGESVSATSVDLSESELHLRIANGSVRTMGSQSSLQEQEKKIEMIHELIQKLESEKAAGYIKMSALQREKEAVKDVENEHRNQPDCSRCETLRKNNEDLKKNIEKLGKGNAAKERELSKLKQEKEILSRQLESLYLKLGKREQDRDDLKCKLSKSVEKNEQNAAEFANLQRIVENLKSEKISQLEQIASLQAENEKIKNDLSLAKFVKNDLPLQQIADLTAKNEVLKEDKRQLEETKLRLEERLRESEREKSELQRRVQELENRCQRLEKQNEHNEHRLSIVENTLAKLITKLDQDNAKPQAQVRTKEPASSNKGIEKAPKGYVQQPAPLRNAQITSSTSPYAQAASRQRPQAIPQKPNLKVTKY